MKLSQIPYKRIELEPLKEKFNTMIKDFKASKNADEQLKIFMEYDKILKNFVTQATLVQIRFTQNVEDKFYLEEKEYFDMNTPLFMEIVNDFYKCIVTSKFKDELKKKLSPLLVEKYEMQLKSFDPSIIPEMQEENKVTTEYVKLMSSGKVMFKGKELAITELDKYKHDKDRSIRAEAFNTHGAFLEKNSAAIDKIFDDLVKIRTRMAKKLGYKDYVDLAYLIRMRNSFDRQDLENFRDEIQKYIVPAVVKLRERQKKELGIDRVMLYDDAIVIKGGNPEPKGTPQDIMDSGAKMYKEMSLETGEFFDFLIEHESFDVIARKGKSGGGYCTSLPDYKLPFVFANFNGTSGDIDVMTHEVGHAFFDYLSRNRKYFDLQVGSGMETYEVHSMSMEFLAYRWMELFYDKADDYRRSHFASALCFLPYGTMVDHFQHIMYEKPELTPEERNKVWKELEGIYRPNLYQDGITYLEKGTRWQYQAHIFENPFYYIDYCLAQTIAFEFLLLIKKDSVNAWKKYMEFLKYSDMKFTDVIKKVGFKTPFEKGLLEEIAKLGEIY